VKHISSGESNSPAAGQEIQQFIELGSLYNIQKCPLLVHILSQSSPPHPNHSRSILKFPHHRIHNRTLLVVSPIQVSSPKLYTHLSSVSSHRHPNNIRLRAQITKLPKYAEPLLSSLLFSGLL